MTDEQIFENEIKCIIRRNECVCNGGSDCIKCDLLMDSEEIVKCYNRAIKNIELINRQKAEIERLENKNTLLLKKKCKDINTARKIIKSEAIKDFAKRLKSKVNDLEFRTKTHRKTVPIKFCDDNANWVMHECIPKEIDKLVKEITEVE